MPTLQNAFSAMPKQATQFHDKELRVLTVLYLAFILVHKDVII